MEGIAIALIGTAIFSHSWYLLGLYADARTVGIIMAAFGLGLLLTLTFEPQLVGIQGANEVQELGQVTMMKGLIILWAIYAAAVAAQALWDLEERAIGFYSVVLTAGSAVFLFFFLQLWIDGADFVVMLPIVVIGALLSLIGGLLFFFMAIPFPALKAVAGWAMLLESIIIVALGLGIMTTVIAYQP